MIRKDELEHVGKDLGRKDFDGKFDSSEMFDPRLVSSNCHAETRKLFIKVSLFPL